MKRRLISVGAMLLAFIVGITFAGISFYNREIQPVEIPEFPVELPDTPPAGDGTLEMVFVLDTTGSMGGLLNAAKEKIWRIVNT